jgi:hypothetical protein
MRSSIAAMAALSRSRVPDQGKLRRVARLGTLQDSIITDS